MSANLDPRRRAFADALGRLLADAVWREITSGNPAAQKCETSPADQARRGFAGDERVEAIRARTDAHP